MKRRYVGLRNEVNSGMTHFGQMVRDGWVFGFIPETEDCANWDAGQMQLLYEKVYAEWKKYAHLPSRLPDKLRVRHAKIHQDAIAHAKASGWNPELGDDD